MALAYENCLDRSIRRWKERGECVVGIWWQFIVQQSAHIWVRSQESGDMSTTLLLVQDVEQTNPNLGPQPYQKPHLLSTTHILNGNVALFCASDLARPVGCREWGRHKID